jgi:diguanylate cyclase (GGDEF)-like protein
MHNVFEKREPEMTTSRQGMTTTKRLHLMLIFTIMFALFSLFSIAQLSKAIQLHHLNFIFIQNIEKLSSLLDEYPQQPLITRQVLDRLKKIKELPEECLTVFNKVNGYIIKFDQTKKIKSICEENQTFVNFLIEDLMFYKEEEISDPILIDTLTHASKVFRINSGNYEEPVNGFAESIKKMITSLFLPFTFLIIFTSSFVLRKIKLKTVLLHDAIDKLEESKKEKEKLAYYDILTSLANRNLFSKILDHEINQAKRYNHTFAILNIDLDRFKLINDTLGHDAGDDLLIQVSQRLKECTRASDTVARFGGDEFVLLISGPNSEKDAPIVAEKIVKQTAIPFMLGENEMHISSSVGISYYPKNGDDIPTLLKHADIAMYEAKENGKNQFRAFDNTIISKLEHRLTLEKDIRNCIERELSLHYQPVVDLYSKAIVGAESLIRWKHPEKGMISPDEFIPIAESVGLIDAIGEWVINEACKQCKIWRDTSNSEFYVAINVSARQLKNNKLVPYIQETLERYSLPINALDVEITESIFYGDDPEAINILNQLSEMGLRLLLDDFGTGYSSLSSLHGMPFDFLKIDRSFMDIKHMKKRIMTKSIIDMANNFGLEIVAEGVEDQDAVDYLLEQGCQFAQGYFFQKPVPAEELDLTKVFASTNSETNIIPINK